MLEYFNTVIIDKTILTVLMKYIQKFCKGLRCFIMEIDKLKIFKILSDNEPLWIKIRNLWISLPVPNQRPFLPNLNMSRH